MGKWKIYALSGTHRFDILNGRYRYSDTDTDTKISLGVTHEGSFLRTDAASRTAATNTFAHHIQYVKTAIDKGTNNSRGYSQPDVCRCVRVCGFNVAGLSVVIEFRVLNR